MAHVALAMSYPYEEERGGEGVYVGALRRYLVSRGHHVDTLISDVVRGRTSPLVRQPLVDAGGGRRMIRRVVPAGPGRYLTHDPRILHNVTSTVLNRPRPPDRASAGEDRWLTRRLASGGYDAVILLLDAVRYAGSTAGAGVPVLALQGFFAQREFRLGDEPGDEPLPADAVAALASAPLVGLNNRAEVAALSRLRDPDSVILVGMAFAEQPEIEEREGHPTVLFVGARQMHNEESLRWFFDAIWPDVLRAHPTARLRVVGSVCRAFGDGPSPNTDLVGVVDDLREHYAAAQVVATPLLWGTSGVKTKVAEALAYGKPLVTTSLGVDPAAPNQFGDAVDVADDPGEFAAAVNRLFADPDLRRKRGAQVREVFRSNFSAEAAYGELIERLNL